MAEHPILMCGTSVLATLEDRKIQTRRVVNRLAGFGKITDFGPSNTKGYDWHFRGYQAMWNDIDHALLLASCPYGQPGDTLWIKENLCQSMSGVVVYAADGMPVVRNGAIQAWAWQTATLSSMFMPRWACRLVLRLTDVRVQRVGDISEEDAMAEGCRGVAFNPGPNGADGILPSNEYAALWNSLNAQRGYPFSANPWVYALTYERA